jgi:tryptophan-rich sensory protein
MHVWRIEPQNSHTEGWVRFYFVQLIFNAGWTIFFFGFHAITVAFIDTLVICFMVVALTASAWEIDKRVTALMIPYALWLFFALYLTAGIWLLN